MNFVNAYLKQRLKSRFIKQMIPKLLTIKGLYSYQTEQIINFDELTKGNLFGIFGNVGAGKSSILEAIMYALYGEVERMGSKGRSYNIMNLRSDDLLILFDFEIEGKLYRSKVQGKRNSKKFNDVKVDSPSFYEFFEDNFKPIDIKTAEELIGLKAEDFKKTIIIPQGTFQDFLQLGDTDRTRMMRELFGLERYELEPKVKHLQSENDNQISLLRSQQQLIGEIKQEDIENKQTQLIDLQKVIAELQIELTTKRRSENELSLVKTDFESLQTTQLKLTELRASEGHFQQLETQINDYELAISTFANLIENHKKVLKDLLQNKVNLQAKQELFDKNSSQLQTFLLSKEKLTPQYEQREMLKKQAEEARKIIEIKGIQKELVDFESRILRGHALITEKIQLLENEKTKAATIEKQRIELRANQPNLTILNSVKDWFTTSHNLQKEIT